jgi:hypothetical protein
VRELKEGITGIALNISRWQVKNKCNAAIRGKEKAKMHNLEQLMTSRTLQKLYQLAQTMPTDVHNHHDLKAAFATSSLGLIEALDNERIHFNSEIDKAMLYALLAVTLDFVLDGRLKTALFTSAIH